MRKARIVEEEAAYYHVISRVVGREFVFDPEDERERFRKMMRRVEGFSGCRILAWTVLSNHFHVLLHVPEDKEVADQEFRRRMRFLYDDERVDKLMDEIHRLRRLGQDEWAERVKAPYVKRMHDMAEFVKTLKQRVSVSFNRRHGRVGTLWEERYKSMLIEGEGESLKAVAAYIDLNAVRAKIVKDPKDYRFSSYGEAVGGSELARAGLCECVGCGSGEWAEASGYYRELLYLKGEERGVQENGDPVRPGYSEQEVSEVLAEKGKLTLGAIIRCRVRYFTDGVILGHQIFVEERFLRYRNRFGVKRETGARAMKGADYGGLCIARQLRVDVFGSRVPA